MRYFLMMLGLIATVICFSGCNDDDNAVPLRSYNEIEVDGRTRDYLVNIPDGTSPDEKLPVVLMIHGTGGSAEQAERDYGWTEKSLREDFIIVYPEGVRNDGRLKIRTWNAGKCCEYAMENDVNDVKFVGLLLDDLLMKYQVDASRIYVAGMSNGGMFVYRLVCEMPGRFAAMAVVSATMMVDEPCVAAESVPLLHIHSELDTKIPYAGGVGLAGYNFTPVDSALNVLKTVNSCGDVTRTEYEGYTHMVMHACRDDVRVESYLLKDGGHSWPGGKKSSVRGDEPSRAIDATEVIWDFFEGYKKEGR